VKTIYVVQAENFDDTLYYDDLEGAEGFVKDQLEMDFQTDIVSVDEVTDEEFDRRMATMEQEDGSVERWKLQQIRWYSLDELFQ
jgi:hypothetical protein